MCARDFPPSFLLKPKLSQLIMLKEEEEENICILKYVTQILNKCALSIFTFIRPIK